MPAQRAIHNVLIHAVIGKGWLSSWPAAASDLFDCLAHEPRRRGVRRSVSCPLDAPAGRTPRRLGDASSGCVAGPAAMRSREPSGSSPSSPAVNRT
jgi:hypothetical protein